MDIQPDDSHEITNVRVAGIKFVTSEFEGSDIIISLLFENGGRLNAYAKPDAEQEGSLIINIDSSAAPSV